MYEIKFIMWLKNEFFFIFVNSLSGIVIMNEMSKDDFINLIVVGNFFVISFKIG